MFWSRPARPPLRPTPGRLPVPVRPVQGPRLQRLLPITGNATDALDASQETSGSCSGRSPSSGSNRNSRAGSLDRDQREHRHRARRERGGSRRPKRARPKASSSRTDLRDERPRLPRPRPRATSSRTVQQAISRLSPKMRAITVLRHREPLLRGDLRDAPRLDRHREVAPVARTPGARPRAHPGPRPGTT